MAAAGIARVDSRSERTKLQLIETAEALMAEHGVEAVSMRQIGVAAGAANPHVVGYHFGSKNALVGAVILHRVPQIEEDRRRQLEDRGGATAGLQTAELVRILYRPLVDAPAFGRTDEYPRFLAAAIRSGFAGIWEEVGGQFAVTLSLIRDIRERVGVPRDIMALRLRSASYLVAAMLDLLRDAAITEPDRRGPLAEECLSQIVAVVCGNHPADAAEPGR